MLLVVLRKRNDEKCEFCKFMEWDNGGEAGIRTLGTRKGSTVFETAPFDHSGTSPTTQSLHFKPTSRNP